MNLPTLAAAIVVAVLTLATTAANVLITPTGDPGTYAGASHYVPRPSPY